MPILVELDPLASAPIASEPTYLSLFGAIGRLAWPNTPKTGAVGNAQRARFKSSIKRYLLTCHQGSRASLGGLTATAGHAQRPGDWRGCASCFRRAWALRAPQASRRCCKPAQQIKSGSNRGSA